MRAWFAARHAEESAMSGEAVKYERQGAVAVVTLDSPDQRNTISVPMVDGIVEACRRASEDLTVGCMVITAAGSMFCAGGNIRDMHERRGHFGTAPAEVRRAYMSGVQRLARTLHAVEVPVIAAVNGAAMGAGFDLALMCDLRIAASDAVFGESFINVGLVSGAGGAWLLTRAAGPATAALLTLTGDRIDAARAHELGIVTSVVPREQLLPEALALAGRIARHPVHTIRMNTRLLRDAPRLDLQAALEQAAALQAIVQQTHDHHEAVSAFIEKRAPRYEGR
jgi:enoyl-CoA hydratase/carnithine racemase